MIILVIYLIYIFVLGISFWNNKFFSIFGIILVLGCRRYILNLRRCSRCVRSCFGILSLGLLLFCRCGLRRLCM